MLVRLRLGFPPSCQQMGAPAQTGFPEGVQAHPSQASAPRRGRPAPTLCHHLFTDAAARGWGGPSLARGPGGALAGPGPGVGGPSLAQVAAGAAVLHHSPAEVGQDLGARQPPPAQLPSVISQLPQLRSSALRASMHMVLHCPHATMVQGSLCQAELGTWVGWVRLWFLFF